MELPWELWSKEIVPKCEVATRFVLRHVSRRFRSLLRSLPLRRNYMIDFCAMNSLDLIRWDRESSYPSILSVEVSAAACLHGGFELISFLLKEKCPFDYNATSALSSRNDIGLIKRLVELDRQTFEGMKSYYMSALEKGNVELFKYYVEGLGLVFTSDIFKIFCSLADKDLILYIHVKFPALSFAQFRDKAIHKSFAQAGRDDLSRWAMENGIPLSPESRLFSEAASHNRVKYMEFLLDNNYPLKDTTDSIKAVRIAIAKCHLGVLKFLHANSVDIFDPRYDEWNHCENITIPTLEFFCGSGFNLDLSRLYRVVTMNRNFVAAEWLESKVAQLPNAPTLDVSHFLQFAIESKDDLLIDKYLNYGEIRNPFPVFSAALGAGNLALIKRFAPRKIDGIYRNNDFLYDRNLIKYLMEDLKVEFGVYFLKEAVERNETEVLELLLDPERQLFTVEDVRRHAFDLLDYRYFTISAAALNLFIPYFKNMEFTEEALQGFERHPEFRNWLIRHDIYPRSVLSKLKLTSMEPAATFLENIGSKISKGWNSLKSAFSRDAGNPLDDGHGVNPYPHPPMWDPDEGAFPSDPTNRGGNSLFY